jgi:hypothetical protein
MLQQPLQEIVVPGLPDSNTIERYKEEMKDVNRLMLGSTLAGTQNLLTERYRTDQFYPAIVYYAMQKPIDQLLPININKLSLTEEQEIALRVCVHLSMLQYDFIIKDTEDGKKIYDFLAVIAAHPSRSLLLMPLYQRTALEKARDETPKPFDAPVISALITLRRLVAHRDLPFVCSFIQHMTNSDIPNLLQSIKLDPGFKTPLMKERIDLIKYMIDEDNFQSWTSLFRGHHHPMDNVQVGDTLGIGVATALHPILLALYNIDVELDSLAKTPMWKDFFNFAVQNSQSQPESEKKPTHWDIIHQGIKACLKENMRFVLVECPGDLASLPTDATLMQIESSDFKHLFNLAKNVIKFRDCKGITYLLTYLGTKEEANENLGKRSNIMPLKSHASFIFDHTDPSGAVVVQQEHWHVTVAPPIEARFRCGDQEEPLSTLIKRLDPFAKIRPQQDGTFTCSFKMPKGRLWQTKEDVYKIFHPEWTNVCETKDLRRMANNHSTVELEVGNSNTFLRNVFKDHGALQVISAVKVSTYYNTKNRFSHRVIITTDVHIRENFRKFLLECVENCKSSKAKLSKSSFPFVRTARPIAPTAQESQERPADRTAGSNRPETVIEAARVLGKKLQTNNDNNNDNNNNNEDKFVLLFASTSEEAVRETLGPDAKWDSIIELTKRPESAVYDKATIVELLIGDRFSNRAKKYGCDAVRDLSGVEVFALYTAQYFLKAIG